MYNGDMGTEPEDISPRPRQRRVPPPHQLELLLAAFGGQCLFRGCDAPGRLSNGTRLLQIAHIYSMAPGSLRFDPRVTHDELVSLENLVFVCPNHHVLIDRQRDTYSPEELTRLRADRIRRSTEPSPANVRRKSITRLEGALEIWRQERTNSSEKLWQSLLEDRPELLYLAVGARPFVLNSQCYVGGMSLDNRGGRVVDFVAQHDGDVTLIEIKTPTTKLLGREYRGGVYTPSIDLVGAVAQTLSYRFSLLNEVHALSRGASQQIAHHIRAVIIVGDAEREGIDGDRRRSFELYRHSSRDVEIHTFDELFLSLEVMKTLTEIEP